jgi:hypothetical protein
MLPLYMHYNVFSRHETSDGGSQWVSMTSSPPYDRLAHGSLPPRCLFTCFTRVAQVSAGMGLSNPHTLSLLAPCGFPPCPLILWPCTSQSWAVKYFSVPLPGSNALHTTRVEFLGMCLEYNIWAFKLFCQC